MLFEVTREGEVDVPAHTYEQVVENTKLTLLKLVSKDRAIIDLLRTEQGSRGFMDFLADMEDQMHLCHSWETLTGEDMKRISLLGGLKDRTLAEKALAEEYSLKQIIQAAVNRESSRANAEALRNRPTNWLEEVEGQYKGGSLEARMNHLQVEMEEVIKLRQVGKYSGRHKGEGEKEQCPRCTYEKHEAGQKCLVEERTCNTCGDRGHFGMSKMCRKKKKKAARLVKEEQKETTREDSDTEEEKEVNRVVRDQVWPGTSGKARKRNVRHITEEGGDIDHDIVVGNYKDEGAGRQEAEGSDIGHEFVVGTYKDEGAGQDV